MKIRRLSGFSSFMLASHLHLMKYLPPQDYTTPPKLFSWPNMAIIPKVTKGNGLRKGFLFPETKGKMRLPPTLREMVGLNPREPHLLEPTIPHLDGDGNWSPTQSVLLLS